MFVIVDKEGMVVAACSDKKALMLWLVITLTSMGRSFRDASGRIRGMGRQHDGGKQMRKCIRWMILSLFQYAGLTEPRQTTQIGQEVIWPKK